MDSARSWFQKFQPRDRVRPSPKNKESPSVGREDSKPMSAEEASNITKQKVAAAKQYIENHYKEQMKNLHERKERYAVHTLEDPYRCFFLAFEFCSTYCIGRRFFSCLCNHYNIILNEI